METITKLKFVITLILAAAISYLALQAILPGATNVGVTNESIVFAAPDTVVAPANHPMYIAAPYLPKLYVSGGAEVSNYTITAEGFNIGADISPDTYLGSYTYYKQAWLAGSNYSYMLIILTFIMGFAVLAKFIGLI